MQYFSSKYTSKFCLIGFFFCAFLLPTVLFAAETTETSEKILANGLKVIVHQDNRAPVVMVQTWYKVGSIDEIPNKTGLAHILEHMMFKGTRNYPDGAFSKQVAAIGGNENAFTSKDHTVYFQTAGAQHLPLLFTLEADRMQHLVLEENAFKKELQVITEERRMRIDDDVMGLLNEQLYASALQVHPYRYPIIGWMSDIENMTLADVRAWYKKFYMPNNATVIVVGDVKPEAVFALAEQTFGKVPAGKLPQRITWQEPTQKGKRWITVHAPAETTLLMRAYRLPIFNHQTQAKQELILSLLAQILDGNASARLPRQLIDTGKAATANASMNGFSRGIPFFIFYLSPAKDQPLSAVTDALELELNKIAESGVSAAELNRAKTQFKANRIFSRDSLYAQANMLGDFEMIDVGWQKEDHIFELMESIDSNDLQMAVKQYFDANQSTDAILIPEKIEAGDAHASH